jgi:hypothetical protein
MCSVRDHFWKSSGRINDITPEEAAHELREAR